MARSALTGSRIRHRRTLLGVRQSELARRLGVSASYLNLIEHNRRRVAPDLLDRVAGELGVETATLSEGADANLLESLRDAAAAHPDATEIVPELDRLEDLAGRFPGWAALLSAQHRRLAVLERTVERLTDRMTHDPHLSASLHEVLSVAASLRSTAAILAETEDIDPDWQERFHRNLHTDSLRLTEGAQALVGYLEASAEDESGLASPLEELEAWLEARDYHVAELEGPRAVAPESLVERQSTLASGSARQLALAWLRQYRSDAEALPLTLMRAAVAAYGPDPVRLAAESKLGTDLPRLFRRLASLPPGMTQAATVGLVICDASGTMTFRKPVRGFNLPRFGAACPLWPLFQALSRPLEPIGTRVEMAGRVPLMFDTFSYCEPRTAPAFGMPAVLRSYMLTVPAPEVDGPRANGGGELPRASGDAAAQPGLPIGTSCRICPRPDCPARREPSIIAQEF